MGKVFSRLFSREFWKKGQTSKRWENRKKCKVEEITYWVPIKKLQSKNQINSNPLLTLGNLHCPPGCHESTTTTRGLSLFLVSPASDIPPQPGPASNVWLEADRYGTACRQDATRTNCELPVSRHVDGLAEKEEN